MKNCVPVEKLTLTWRHIAVRRRMESEVISTYICSPSCSRCSRDGSLWCTQLSGSPEPAVSPDILSRQSHIRHGPKRCLFFLCKPALPLENFNILISYMYVLTMLWEFCFRDLRRWVTQEWVTHVESKLNPHSGRYSYLIKLDKLVLFCGLGIEFFRLSALFVHFF